jgi:alpha-L-rhamnosidase
MGFIAGARRLFPVLVMAGIAVRACGEPAAPVGLLVTGVSHPLAIDRDAVRFTWRSADTNRGETQTAYRILVASCPQYLAARTGEWWDSGKVEFRPVGFG